MSSSASSGPSPLSETSSRSVGMRLNSLAGQLSQVPFAHSPYLAFYFFLCVFALLISIILHNVVDRVIFG
jgi:hypothetical protein